ncbi:MAG: hypothetical protein ABW153_18190, partial [Sedimenticola sp.]
MDHLPVLVVIIPLLTAPLCVLLDHPRLAWLAAVVSSWLSFGAAVGLVLQVSDTGPISYLLGNWEAPWGIEYRIDVLAS